MHRYIDEHENSAEVSAAIARYRAGRSYREAQDRTPDSRRQPGGGSDVGSAGKRRAKAESTLLCRFGELDLHGAVADYFYIEAADDGEDSSADGERGA